MDDLPIRLEQFRNAFRPAGGTHGQQIGEESYALRCNGRALSVLAEAADEITRLRAELAECKRDAERYRTALEQIVAPFEDLNFVSGNKLLTYIHDVATVALAAKEG